jgi:putative aminopeptidase FrvX
MKSKEFLKKYLDAYAPVAQETEGQTIWLDYVKQFADSTSIDAYGTGMAVRLASHRDSKNETKKVVIEAHCDEIAWIITHIEDSGYIRVKRHGGSDNLIAPSKSVIIHTHNGKKVEGVFGWPAIHTRGRWDKEGYEEHELWIDTGLKDKDAVSKAGVEVGCLVTYDTPFSELGDYYIGRSLDNKIGGYIIAETLKRLHENKIRLPFDLFVVNSVQEEVGLYGARMIAKRLQADLALVHDVCHNTDHPKMDKAKDGDTKGGLGPCLEYTAQNHRKINAKLREIANANDIPVQLTVGSYGNDTMSFFLENTPTAILATPLKYMHTTVEMAHKNDVEDAIELFYQFLTSIDVDWIDNVNNK